MRCPAGRYGSLANQTACVDCPVGSFSSSAGSQFCPLCRIGRYTAVPLQQECTQCKPGTFTNTTGASFCHVCVPGKFASPGERSGKCTQCPPGKANPSPAAISCDTCDSGTFSAALGATSCTLCTAGTHAPYPGHQSCSFCGPATWSPDGSADCIPCDFNTIAPHPSTAACVPCPNGAAADDEQITCICPTGTVLVGTSGEALRYENDRITNALNDGNKSIAYFECTACPDGAVCDHPGTTFENLKTLPGWWRPDALSTHFTRCMVLSHCNGGATGTCEGHRTGTLCASCEVGYVALTEGGTCIECPDENKSTVLSALLFVLAVVSVFGMYWLVIRLDAALVEDVKQQDAASTTAAVALRMEQSRVSLMHNPMYRGDAGVFFNPLRQDGNVKMASFDELADGTKSRVGLGRRLSPDHQGAQVFRSIRHVPNFTYKVCARVHSSPLNSFNVLTIHSGQTHHQLLSASHESCICD
jgi:hypothetical protein